MSTTLLPPRNRPTRWHARARTLRGIEVPIHSHLHSYDGRGINIGARPPPIGQALFLSVRLTRPMGFTGMSIVPVLLPSPLVQSVGYRGERQASRMNGHGNDCVRVASSGHSTPSWRWGSCHTGAREVFNQHTLDVGVKWLESRNVIGNAIDFGLIDGFNDSSTGSSMRSQETSPNEGQRYKQGVNTCHETNSKRRQGHKKTRDRSHADSCALNAVCWLTAW